MAEITSQIVFNIPLIPDVLSNELSELFSVIIEKLVEIEDINKFSIAKDIDENYFNNYLIAKKAGVKFLAYKCIINSKEIKIKEKIKILDE